MAVEADTGHSSERSGGLVPVPVGFLREVLPELAQALLKAGWLGEFARSLIFDDYIAVEGVLDTAELRGVPVAIQSDTGNLGQVRVKELLYLDLKLHFAAGAVSDAANGFRQLGWRKRSVCHRTVNYHRVKGMHKGEEATLNAMRAAARRVRRPYERFSP
jgi:hypothetical protein